MAGPSRLSKTSACDVVADELNSHRQKSIKQKTDLIKKKSDYDSITKT